MFRILGCDNYSTTVQSLLRYEYAYAGRSHLALHMFDAGLDPRQKPAAMKSIVKYHMAAIKCSCSESHYTCPQTWTPAHQGRAEWQNYEH
jgi:hypothetical protein